MKNHRSLLAVVLALALALTAFTPALGAETAPSLRYTQNAGAFTLTLQGLSAESIYGAQVELTIPGSCTDAQFTPSKTSAYAPPCHRVETQDATLVTIYLTAQSPLNQGSSLSLGTLRLTGAGALPETAQLTLLDRDLKPLVDAQSVTVTQETSGSTGGGGGGGGLRPGGNGGNQTTPSGNSGGGGGGGSGATAALFPFTDVAQSAWYYDAVKYVYEKGMMNGTATTAFSPETTTSRAMLVTILYRLAGQPAAQGATYPDVEEGQYYTAAVGWASQNRVVVGYETGLFQPNAAITREQMATILYRYAALTGADITARGDVSAFTDADTISPYAAEAMAWAVGTGLISGMGDGTVAPTGQATRAQVATILTRFCQK